MKFWIYGYRIFKKNRILNGILALQIFISILLLNLTIGRYSMQMQSVTMFADLIDYQGIYYMPADILNMSQCIKITICLITICQAKLISAH